MPKIKIDDNGTIREAHCCFGCSEECEYAAVCETCGRTATPLVPVLVWSDEDGLLAEAICGIHAQHQGISVAK